MDPTCIFCKIIAKEIPASIVYEDAHFVCFMDIHPIAPGHTLVVPRNHSTDLLHMASKDRKELLDVVSNVAPAIMKAVGAHGFNLGFNTGKAAGQAVFHTHAHIIPRREKDGLSDWPSAEKIPTGLDQLAKKIKQNM
jgi:histidine triad (HIT) family protein